MESKRKAANADILTANDFMYLFAWFSKAKELAVIFKFESNPRYTDMRFVLHVEDVDSFMEAIKTEFDNNEFRASINRKTINLAMGREAYSVHVRINNSNKF